MKNGNLYQRIKSAKKEEVIASAKRYEVELAMKKELEEAIKIIQEKYEPILKTLHKDEIEKGAKLWNLAKIYRSYGEFGTHRIADIVAIFLTYIEGEKYIVYRNWNNSKITENSIIIKDDVNKQYDEIDYETIETLYNNGDLIILNYGFSNMVSFYNNIGEPMYYLGQFNYLYEFVNRLIQYRIDNDKKNITDVTVDDLYLFMRQFILSHPDLAQKNKEKREQMLMSQEETDTVITGCNRIRKILK